MKTNALLAALLLIAAAPAFAAVPLHLGDSVTAAIDPVSDSDTFSFEAPAGTKLALRLSGVKGGMVPALALFGPDGAAIDPGGLLTEKNGKLKLKALVLDRTGVYRLVVSSGDGATGAYTLSMKGKVPKSVKAEADLSPGATRDVAVFGVAEAQWKVKLKGPKGLLFRVVGVFDPAGTEVLGGSAAFGEAVPPKKGSLFLSRGFGGYSIRLGNAEAVGVVRVTVKVKLPKIAKAKLALSDVEPRPTGVSPKSGIPGSTVTITGTGFSNGCVATIGGKDAKFTSVVSSTTINAGVPSGVPVNVPLGVSVRDALGQENGLAGVFTVQVPPTITSVAPALAAPGDVVNVFGTLFEPASLVRFRLTDSPKTTVLGPTALTAVVPGLAGVEGPTDVSVVNDGGLTARKIGAIVIETRPTVTSVEPASASPGDTVTVRGTSFKAGAIVRFADLAAAKISLVSDTEISAEIPSSGLPAGPVDVTVVKKFGSKAVLLDGLAILEGPSYEGLLITGVVDGPRSGGLPKAVELYATVDIADLSEYGIDVASNGTGFSGANFTLSGSAKAGDFLYVASEAVGFTAYFGYAPDFTTNELSVNGNDAVALYRSGELLDVYGDPSDVSGGSDHSADWDFQDGYAYRKSDLEPSTTFSSDDWDISGKDVLDIQGASGKNGDAGVAVPFGTW